MHRRGFLGTLATVGVGATTRLAAAAGGRAGVTPQPGAAAAPASAGAATRFEYACMTLAYAAFPFARALQGIALVFDRLTPEGRALAHTEAL